MNVDAILKYVFLFLFGGFCYYFLEIFLRGYSHFSMILCAGVCFVLIGALNQGSRFRMSLICQVAVSTLLVTALEFATGMVVNIWLGLGVWDYSELPFNVQGQICLPFSLLWMVASLLCIFLDDWLRHHLFGEEKATYKIL